MIGLYDLEGKLSIAGHFEVIETGCSLLVLADTVLDQRDFTYYKVGPDGRLDLVYYGGMYSVDFKNLMYSFHMYIDMDERANLASGERPDYDEWILIPFASLNDRCDYIAKLMGAVKPLDVSGSVPF